MILPCESILEQWDSFPAEIIRSQFWGGIPGQDGRSKYFKVVMTPCSGGDIVSFYCQFQIPFSILIVIAELLY